MIDDRTVEGAVRSALRSSVAGVLARADEADAHRRVRVRARRHRAIAVGSAVVLVASTVTVLALTRRGTIDTGAVATTVEPSTVPIAGTTATTGPIAPACTMPAALPFEPTTLLSGWTRSPYVRSVNGTPEHWLTTDRNGIVEIWNGVRADGVPEPSPTETITVLGVPAEIGPISDGFSVVFRLGPTPCDRWALVAHPGIGQAELRTIAEGLRLTTTKVYSWRTGLTVAGTATVADPTMTSGADCAASGGSAQATVISGVYTETLGVAPVGAEVLVSVCASATPDGPRDKVTVMDLPSGQTLVQFSDTSASVTPLARFGVAVVAPAEARTGDTVTVTLTTEVAPLCGDLATVFQFTSTGLGNGGLLDPQGGWKDDRSHPQADKDCTPESRALPRSYIVPAELAPGDYLVCVGVDTIPEACGRFTVRS